MTLPQDDTRSAVGYVDEMRRRSFDALSRLHAGVTELVLTDFPDYENIGDSVIALGQAAFWAEAGIAVRETSSWRTVSERTYESRIPVAIQGGGNFGGLYPQHSEHRYRLAERLRPGILLIQEPQSVHFVSASDEDEFASRMAGRPGLRMAVRDRASYDAVRPHVTALQLAPDSVHMLGRLEGSAPTEPVVYLLRRDQESALSQQAGVAAVDWPAMTFADRLVQRIRRTLLEGAITRSMNRQTERWFSDASRRLATGVALIAPGETIVTDRLHAMLIALQLGRRVIAIDNANGKLTNYAHAWFEDLDLPLDFATSLDEAQTMV